MPVRREKYTVVQHSAFGYCGKTGFKQGLEERSLTPNDEKRVREVGGLVFDTYGEAADYAFDEMYEPVQAGGLYPRAPGTFSDKVVDGLRIYIPAKVEADA